MKLLLTLLLSSPLAIYAGVLEPSSDGYDVADILQAQRGGVLTAEKGNMRKQLRLVCVEKSEDTDECETYNFLITRDLVSRTTGVVSGSLIEDKPIPAEVVESRRAVRRHLREDARSRERQINLGYIRPAQIMFYPVFLALRRGNGLFYFLLPVSIPLGAASLPPFMLAYSGIELNTQTRFRRYLRNVVRDRNRNTKIGFRAFEAIEKTYIRAPL